jgi:L-iditol 2-dehydrogenase
MKAAVLTGLGKIETREIPDPRIEKEDDVFLLVGSTGLCGSDVHYYREGGIGDQRVRYPFVVGHECSGIVEKIGPAVQRLKKGDRVAVDPAIVCGRCDQCLAGRTNTCRNLLYLGTPGQLPGSLCDFIVVPERNCHLLSEGMTLEEGALVEPLTIGLYSFKMIGGFRPVAIAVLGSGPIGLSVILAARAYGVRTIFATDKVEARVKAAIQAGADWSGNPDHQDIVAEIRGREAGLLDAAYECCGDQEALDQGIELLKPGGKLFIIGIPTEGRVSFDIHRIRRHEISVHNVRRQRDCIPEAVGLIGSGRADVRFMATHVFGIDEAAAAFELVRGYRDGVIRAIIRPAGS